MTGHSMYQSHIIVMNFIKTKDLDTINFLQVMDSTADDKFANIYNVIFLASDIVVKILQWWKNSNLFGLTTMAIKKDSIWISEYMDYVFVFKRRGIVILRCSIYVGNMVIIHRKLCNHSFVFSWHLIKFL